MPGAGFVAIFIADFENKTAMKKHKMLKKSSKK